MGIEFFNRTKGAIRKCRDNQKEKIATELTPIVEEVQIISVIPSIEQQFCEEQKFEVRLENKKLAVYHERVLIGVSEKVSPKLAKDIQDIGGIALGKFDRVRPHSKQLDISVCLRKE